ncbi:hypothetical protein D5086_027288 [Populus alba]|uniref:Uncharacterized protein n=1 Tax=Populus alba TaxID=43335 RepID=A0ACC4AUW9_POPAL
MLYTKAPLIYSRAGIVLRFISSLLSVTAFITFQVKIDKHDYSTTDIAITYLLFAAAVFLEFYAFVCLVLSDWTMIWLSDKGGNALTGAIYSLRRKLTRSERWSRSISQYNLISSSIQSEPPSCLKLLGIDEMMRQMHVNRKDLNGELQGLIFEHLREKAWKMMEDLKDEELKKEEYYKARKKYLDGMTAMSASSPDEDEVEELQKIVAIKEQELELLRSRLAASTPRKGNGEFEEDQKYDVDD